MGWLAWVLPLIVVGFLFSLNEFLNGRLKEVTGGILALLGFGLCAVGFIFSGWIAGLAAFVGLFALVALFRYPAYRVARKLTKYPELGAAEYRQREYQRLTRDLESPDWTERLERKELEESHLIARIVEKALRRQDIQEVLKVRSCSKQDVEAFCRRIEISSLPPNLRELAACNATMLDYFLRNSVAAEANGRYVRNVKNSDTAITLTLWAEHNPEGSEP